MTGTSYGIIAPLACGVSMIVDESEFDAQRWYEILETRAVSVWYTAPTAIRMLMKAGVELRARARLPSLRFLASVGEPLNPEAVVWGVEAFGRPFHDNWWQTETGGDHDRELSLHGGPARDRWAGRCPASRPAIVRPRDDGGGRLVDEPDRRG